ncbi:MAG: DUF1016 N-terminal domain-containing protein, partial [Acidobacteriota bacterium]|nr:DUF1016 N-terminal domain-containing protein [Acidobacteriota bacterium]
MSNLNLERYVDAVQKIKAAILQSRYRAASMANAEQLKLYYGIGRYVSDNSRFGKWGSGAIEAISKQLQQELPGLRGFSATNIRYMRIFFEAWADEFEPNRHLPTDDLAQSVSQIANRPLPTAILYEDTAEIPIHQLTTDELSSERRAIFGIRVEQGIGSGLMSGFHPSDELCARSEITGEMERMEKTGSPKVTAFKCPNCGAAANPDSASCHYCGAALTTRVCPSCFHA